MALAHSLPAPELIESAVRFALREDVGSGDVSANLCENSIASAHVLCRENAVLSGTEWFIETFRQLDKGVSVTWFFHDGDTLHTDDIVCHITGAARSILTGERTALNFLQTLSGTATTTQQAIATLGPNAKTRLLDTRKTIPGLRHAQKYAVLCGGGTNHRMGLFDAYLIKENHIAACGSISNAVQQARNAHDQLTIEVEVETLEQLVETIDCDADIALLDNFDYDQILEAVQINKGRIKLEVSGNVSTEELAHYGDIGIDFISMGALTKHLHAIDFSLRLK